MTNDHMPMLVGIADKAHSGKDTLGAGLAEQAGFVTLSFADPIWRCIADLLGVTVPKLESIKNTPQPLLSGRTPRCVAQTLGRNGGAT